MLQGQTRPALLAEQGQVVIAVSHLVHPARLPGGELFRRLTLTLITQKHLMVAVVMTRHGRGMRAPRRVNDGADAEAGCDNAVGVAVDDLRRDNFLRADDDVPT